MAGSQRNDRISLEELRYISLFQDLTGAMAYRAIEDEEGGRIFYLVDKKDVGKAIGRDGRNVKMLAKLLNKEVEIVSYSEDLRTMVENLFPGVTIIKVDVSDSGDGKTVYVKVKEDEKGKAIGRDGRKAKRARIILNKLFSVEKVIIR